MPQDIFMSWYVLGTWHIVLRASITCDPFERIENLTEAILSVSFVDTLIADPQ